MNAFNLAHAVIFGICNVAVVAAISIFRRTISSVASDKRSKNIPNVSKTVIHEDISKTSKMEVKPVAVEGEDCTTCAKSLPNSVKKIDMHVVVCEPGPWVKRVESEEGSLLNLLNTAISDSIKENNMTTKIKLTACDRESTEADMVDIIVYPRALMYRLSRHDNTKNIQEFAKYLLLDNIELDPCVLVENLPWSKLILVCNHGARDKRCGRAGPILIEEINQQLRCNHNKSNVVVFGTSHIGGHEFAGTLVIYPEGKCFGYMTKNKVAVLLDYVCNDNLDAFQALSDTSYRGQYNNSW